MNNQAVFTLKGKPLIVWDLKRGRNKTGSRAAKKERELLFASVVRQKIFAEQIEVGRSTAKVKNESEDFRSFPSRPWWT